MTDLDALIRDLERATGPDRELSDRVLLACGMKEVWWQANYWWLRPGDDPQQPLIPHNKRPDPTASLDDALSLVLDPTEPHGFDRPQKWPSIPSPIPNRDKPFRAWVTATQKKQWGATPALAACIAALKARRENQ